MLMTKSGCPKMMAGSFAVRHRFEPSPVHTFSFQESEKRFADSFILLPVFSRQLLVRNTSSITPVNSRTQ